MAFLGILKETATDWLEDKAMRLSAALALYTMLSLAPLLVITLKLVAFFVSDRNYARNQITDQVTDLLGWRVAEAIQPMIDNGGKAANGLTGTILSTALLLFAATGVFAELQDSMNTIWGVKPRPNRGIWDFIRTRLLSLAMVFGTGFLLLVSMFITSTMDTLTTRVAGDAKWLGVSLDIAISFGVVSVLFAGIFKFLPDVKLSSKNVWLGAAITAGLFTAGKYALALYFKLASPTSVFGAAGSLAAVLLWVYYSSFILFFGAEFTKVWSVHRLRDRIVPEEHAVKVTEEDRAEQGIPTRQRMNDAVAGRLCNSPSGQVGPAASPRPPGSVVYAVAAVSAAIGMILGGLGTRYLIGRRRRATRK